MLLKTLGWNCFGNDPAKISRYVAFWNREDVTRPLTGFSLQGWFPFAEFAACAGWRTAEYLTPEMIEPEAFLDDHLRLLREGQIADDDVIRGACPTQVAVPWLPGILGCRLRILPDNVLGEDRCLDWNEALKVRLDPESPWFQKYVEFIDALVRTSAGAFPVSHGPEIGPTDLHAILRGHGRSVLDLVDEPERSRDLLAKLGEIFVAITKAAWDRIPLFHGGYFDAQYSLWAPGPIIRMQEDATASYSPALYRRFVQPVDRMVAEQFPNSFIHLHSTSMFLLDSFLEIEAIRCFQVNNDVGGPPVPEMIRHFQKIQKADRPLVIRGSFTGEELRMLRANLDPRGLFLNIMVSSQKEIAMLRPLTGM